MSQGLIPETTKSSSSLVHTLMLWFLVLALVPMTLVAWLAYQQANKSLTVAAINSLEQASELQSSFIKNWFNSHLQDLNSQAEAQSNAFFLQQLRQGLLQSGKKPQEYIKSFAWARLVDEAQNDLILLSRRYDYIFDILLIDNQGNVLYSVSRQADLGNNLLQGPFSTSRFAKSVQKTLTTGEEQFSDLEYYAPAQNRLTSFLTAPLLDEFGDKLGVFAIQVNLAAIFELINAQNKEQSSLIHYLVGEDGYLRSAIFLNGKKTIIEKINTRQLQLWQTKHGSAKESQTNHQEIAIHYMGPNGEQVIGVHKTIRLPGTNWALISEINHDEALAAANWMGKVTIILVLLTGLVVSIIAFVQAKRITQPLTQLANTAMAVAEGNQFQQVSITENNEIGTLADAFNHMLLTRQTHEKALQNSHLKLQQTLGDLEEQKYALDQHAIVAITDVKGTITFVNEKFSEISGYSQDELLGQNHRILKSGVHDSTFFKTLYQTIANGKVWHGEICNKAKDNHLYWVDTTIVPFIGHDRKPKSYIAIRADISERKNAEQALKLAIKAAEAANEAKGEFLANMSHEIRTPMNGIIGMTNLLLDSPLDTVQNNRAQTVLHSAESLLTIINDILDFSKIEAGKLTLEILEFDLGAMIEDFATTMAFRAEDKELELICSANPSLHQWYQGDPGRIRQILNNLVGNAIKFTKQGEVSVCYQLLSIEDGKSLLKFEVKDTGIGLSKQQQQQQKLFQKFSQADSSTTRKYGGTGLGLAITKQLVELMGGEIGIKSSPNQGSTFWFTLRLEQAKTHESLPQRENLLNEKILVVDDNATNRELMCQIFQAWQVEHQQASNGPMALGALYAAAEKEAPFSMALLDMQMPGMDGKQLGKRIREDTLLNTTKLVLITSQGQRGEAKKMKNTGFNAYLSKPIRQSQLYNTLLLVAGLIKPETEAPIITRYTSLETRQFNARILVVEDNITNQTVARGMLKKFGLKVDMTANGEEALKALRQLPYDLVFMDCQMPIMDGYQATRQIRNPKSRVKDHTIPIIAMTANAMQGDRNKCLDAGMDDYISKPIVPGKIHHILEQWLPKDHHHRQAKHIKEETDKNLLNKISTCEALDSPNSMIFDYNAMSKRLMGDSALMQAVAAAFMDDIPVQIEQLKTQLAQDNIKQASSQAHKIKGAAVNVGGMALGIQAANLEQAGRSGDIQTIREGLAELENRFAQLKVAMQETLL